MYKGNDGNTWIVGKGPGGASYANTFGWFTNRVLAYIDSEGNFTTIGGGAFGSDIRYKDIISYRQIDLETIVNAPLFSFKWNDREDKEEHLGTSAQYWMGTQFKDAVNTTNKDFKGSTQRDHIC
jgi:hypothetical protein